MHITASAVNSIALCLYYGIYGYEGDEQQVKSKGIGSDPFNFLKIWAGVSLAQWLLRVVQVHGSVPNDEQCFEYCLRPSFFKTTTTKKKGPNKW